VHQELLAKAIYGISSEVTFDDFRFRSGIFSKIVAKNVLEFLTINGIGSFSSDNMIIFSQTDRMKTAITALQMGCDIEKISKALNWKDFESLSSEVLHLLGYRTETNVRFTKPRIQIDVIGVNSRFAIVADCKHWRRANQSVMSVCAKKQAERTKFLIDRKNDIDSAVPIILSLYAMKVQFIGGVPIVPISRFRAFVDDIQAHLQEIYVIFAG
jgi:hypothetical protein